MIRGWGHVCAGGGMSGGLGWGTRTGYRLIVHRDEDAVHRRCVEERRTADGGSRARVRGQRGGRGGDTRARGNEDGDGRGVSRVRALGALRRCVRARARGGRYICGGDEGGSGGGGRGGRGHEHERRRAFGGRRGSCVRRSRGGALGAAAGVGAGAGRERREGVVARRTGFGEGGERVVRRRLLLHLLILSCPTNTRKGNAHVNGPARARGEIQRTRCGVGVDGRWNARAWSSSPCRIIEVWGGGGEGRTDGRDNCRRTIPPSYLCICTSSSVHRHPTRSHEHPSELRTCRMKAHDPRGPAHITAPVLTTDAARQHGPPRGPATSRGQRSLRLSLSLSVQRSTFNVHLPRLRVRSAWPSKRFLSRSTRPGGDRGRLAVG
ncbi:hypothetical protein OF83DRAFT_436887 [Amylostereum chailletii]|nr:hypothetical protein OF83DRAFT_436887 [Amylostereum chailletii]